MKKIILTIVVLKLMFSVHRVHSQSSIKEFTYESDSKTTLLRKDLAVRNYENLTSIGDILELFSVDVIGAQWTNIHKKLSTSCAHNMVEYLNGLEKKEIWAMKSKLAEC